MAIVITDLDGTLLSADRTISRKNWETLEALGARGITRVIATGRSLYSARMALPCDTPIDYLIFSTGAGVLDWRSQELLKSECLESEDIRTIGAELVELNLDFMIHAPAPDNHYFHYRERSVYTGDFLRRVERYREFAAAFVLGNDSRFPVARGSQFLAIAATGQEHFVDAVRSRLSAYSVVRATSPLDYESIWIEIFPSTVSKAKTSAWVAARLALDADDAVIVGNDTNDLDMLEWGGQAFVVANATGDLPARFATVAANDSSGFAEAVLRSGIL